MAMIEFNNPLFCKGEELSKWIDFLSEERVKIFENEQEFRGIWIPDSGSTKIEKTWFEYYESLFLSQGKPSVYSCWLQTLGFAKKLKPEITVQDFPCPGTFDRKLKKKYPKSAIYMARFGEKKWNEKYGNYIERDYSGIRPG